MTLELIVNKLQNITTESKRRLTFELSKTPSVTAVTMSMTT